MFCNIKGLENCWSDSQFDPIYFQLLRSQHWTKHTFRPISMNGYLSWPKLSDISERRIRCQIINHNDSMCPFVVCASDSSKPFLSSSIPNLKFDLTPVNVKWPEIVGIILEAKINSNSSKIALLELIIREPSKQWTFANRAVSNNYYLE